MKRIFLISTIPIEKEGRIKRIIDLIKENFIIDIYSPKSTYFSKNTNTFTISDDIPRGYVDQLKYLKNTNKLVRKRKNVKYDYIYLCNYTCLPFVRKIMKRNKNSEIIYDAFELLLKTNNENKSLRYHFYRYLEKKIVLKASKIIVANFERGLIMQGDYHLQNTPICINNVPFEIDYQKVNSLHRSKKDKKEILNIVYAGFISKSRKLIELIDIISKHSDKFSLHIYGYGDYYDEVVKYLHMGAIKNVIIHGGYSQENLNNILSSYDVGYIYYPNTGLNNIFCEPHKIYDYAMNFLPMISFYNENLNSRFDKYQIGISNDELGKHLDDMYVNYKKYVNNICDFLTEIEKLSVSNKNTVINSIFKGSD
ncbi:MAG: hypothetical protein PHP65_00575 [Bacilli bacterium]|nr:hypothetical protein [Bacilli bacterium]